MFCGFSWVTLDLAARRLGRPANLTFEFRGTAAWRRFFDIFRETLRHLTVTRAGKEEP
jgi:hypothetical protein